MPRTRTTWCTGLALAAALVFGSATQVHPQKADPTPPLKLSAFAVNMGTVGSTRPGLRTERVDITIQRWSTEQERAALIQAFQEKGPDGLLAALQKTKPVGWIRRTGKTSWDLHYAVQAPTDDGGRQILLATDRPVGIYEASRDGRTMDYPFSLIELHLDQNGEGEGKLALATKIARSKDGKRIELENYSSEPVRLEKVRTAN